MRWDGGRAGFGRPFGTHGVFINGDPNAEALGYSRRSLRDEGVLTRGFACVAIAGVGGSGAVPRGSAVFWPASRLHAMSAGRATRTEGLVPRTGELCRPHQPSRRCPVSHICSQAANNSFSALFAPLRFHCLSERFYGFPKQAARCVLRAHPTRKPKNIPNTANVANTPNAAFALEPPNVRKRSRVNGIQSETP